MSNKKEPVISRRDFLAKSSMVLGIFALSPPTVLGEEDPLKVAPKNSKIVKYAIYPTIGICRVGNSDEHFFGPEIPGLPPDLGDGYKDKEGKIKRQAQRFRIYAFDAKGRVVKEITQKDSDITWSVKLANTKAAWYSFNMPLDMGKFAPGLPGKLRNDFFTGPNRKCLEITPDEVLIMGKSVNQQGTDEKFRMAAPFWQKPNLVKSAELGSVRTDEKGRLIVVPGNGTSASAMPLNPIVNFSDNDGWYDDWADGWVKANIKLKDGEEIEAEPAWVACTGVDFAPEIQSFITMYDVLRDVMVNGKKKPLDKKPEGKLSFKEEIYPFFRRLGLMEWTAASAELRESWINTGDFLDEDYMRKLTNPSPENKDFRMSVFKNFRNPKDYKLYDNQKEFKENIQYKIPYMLGSGINYEFSPAHWFAMPHLQFEILKDWAEGNFINDYGKPLKVDKTKNFDDIPLSQQPMALTRAALDPLSGGSFHPGVELTWPLRQQALYSDTEPYRIKIGNRDTVYEQVEKLGLLLTSEVVFGNAVRAKTLSGESYSYYNLPKESPIGPQNPGDLTRWLGLPWQPDAFSCQAVLYANDFPNAAWWPAHLPINILTEYSYKQLERDNLDDESKLKFFYHRELWTRGVPGIGYHVQGSYNQGLTRMIELWWRMGFVIKRSRPNNLSQRLNKIIPEYLYVETGRGSMDVLTDAKPNEGISSKKND